MGELCSVNDSLKLASELEKAKLDAVRTLAEVCRSTGITVETQVLAAKTLLEFKLRTARNKPLSVQD